MKTVRFAAFVAIGAMALAGAPLNSAALVGSGGNWDANLCTEKIVSSGIWVSTVQYGRSPNGEPVYSGIELSCLYQRFNPLPKDPCEKGLIIEEIHLMRDGAIDGGPCHYRIRCCPNIAGNSLAVAE
jgi:hypothetical protein